MKGTMGIIIRRESAKKQFESQLKRGTKPEKVDGKTTSQMVELTPADVTRINREIERIETKKK